MSANSENEVHGQAATGVAGGEMHVFLDANIYLAFYRYSDDDLDELRKLIAAVGQPTTTLYVTQQVKDEFERNREATIVESLKSLDEVKVRKSFARIFTNLPEYERLRVALDEYEALRGALSSQARSRALDRSLHADDLIAALFEAVPPIARTDEIVRAARNRVELGNPPGKRGSLGDAVNWETLLREVPDGQPLILVSADDDFRSPLDPGGLHGFLSAEWHDRKASGTELFRSLNSLFGRYYPHIKLAAELERDFAVSRLVESESFLETHAAIRDLSGHSGFSDVQVQELVRAANRNTQIKWILADPDVQEFFVALGDRYQKVIDAGELDRLRESLTIARRMSEMVEPMDPDAEEGEDTDAEDW